MKEKFLYAIALLVLLVLLQQPIEAKKVTIHVPYRVRKVKHTHTIYKVMPRYEHTYHDKEDTESDDNYDV